jgi:hypothetical protein
MGDTEIQEVAAAAQQVVGFSAYLHGIGYDLDRFKQELDSAVSHIKSQGQR